MEVLKVAGIALMIRRLFIGLPLLGLIKAWPEVKRMSTTLVADPPINLAGRQRTPPRRAGPCRRGIQERQAHRTTRRIRGW
jgi:hypothetical protein